MLPVVAGPLLCHLLEPAESQGWLQRSGCNPLFSVPAVLFERSRHACYVLLTGPQSSDGPGWVSVAKRKLKEDITGSRVIWLSQVAGDSEQYIRDRFFRMRFSSRM